MTLDMDEYVRGMAWLDQSIAGGSLSRDSRLYRRVLRLWILVDERAASGLPHDREWSRLKRVLRSLATRPREIARMPGARIDCTLRFICTKRFYDRRVQQTMADFEEEYFEALAEGAQWRARWRRCQLYVAIVRLIVMSIPMGALRAVIAVWRG